MEMNGCFVGEGNNSGKLVIVGYCFEKGLESEEFLPSWWGFI